MEMKMKATKFVKRCSFVLAILTMLKLNGVVVASVYTVGDEEGWSSQTNFDSWASKYNFSVGDVLVFKYVKGEHNAYEVTETTFRSCDASSGVLAKYESGEDEVLLSQPKTYCFICNVAGHCLGGMRFRIQVKQSNSSHIGDILPPALPPQIHPPLSDHSSAIYASQTWTLIMAYLVPFGLLLLNLCYFL